MNSNASSTSVPMATDIAAATAASDLPSADAKHLFLAQPTDEERLAQLHKNGVFWRGALSLDAYLRREDHLAAQAMTQGGGLTNWMLFEELPDKEEEEEEGEAEKEEPDAENGARARRRALCGCESFRKRGVVAFRGTLQDTTCHGVGSVFCPTENRGRGYASRMMKELGEQLATWQAGKPGALFSVLFSDIGKSFYAAHGWQPFESAHIALPPLGSPLTAGLPETAPLYKADLPELCAADERLLRASLARRARAEPERAFVALIPDVDTIDWHHAREEFVGTELLQRAPEIKGAIAGSVAGKRVWCYWTRMWYNPNAEVPKENTMHILRLVVEAKDDSDWEDAAASPSSSSQGSKEEDDDMEVVRAIAAVLAAAQREASKWNVEDVQLWNPSRTTVAAAQMLCPGLQVVQRDSESITSLRWYGGQEVLGKVVWMENEKFGWC